MRVAGSLKLGTVSASDLMRTLQGGKNQSTLSKAIAEVGRIAKTLYLLNYIDDEAYRRRILTYIRTSKFGLIDCLTFLFDYRVGDRQLVR